MMKEDYLQRIAALREENELLRQAAQTFSALAERLADQLRELRDESAVGAMASRGTAPNSLASKKSRSGDLRRPA